MSTAGKKTERKPDRPTAERPPAHYNRGESGATSPRPVSSGAAERRGTSGPEGPSFMKSPSSAGRPSLRRGSVEYGPGTEADHEAVYQTLLHIFHAPDRESFLGALSDPYYRPDQRLLAKVDSRVVSHVHLTERPMRYGSSVLPLNGVMWVGTLPEYRRLGFAHNLMKLAAARAAEGKAVVQTLTTGMPRFYRDLGWGVCGRHCFAQIASRNVPSIPDVPLETKGGPWHVRPWRQVEIDDLMSLYDRQFAGVTGTIARTEDYWRWIIGRRYAHVIWVACQGEAVRGYAFVKDYKILEIAAHPDHPLALKALLGRVRSEALERAYPEVVVHAHADHPVMELLREAGGRVVDQEEWDGMSLMYSIPDPIKFLTAATPELKRRAAESGGAVELGLTVNDKRFLIHADAKNVHVEPDKLSRRHITLSAPAFVRLALGHTGVDRAVAQDGAEPSTHTTLDSARILFPQSAIWRSPLDSATA